ncbi:hypothetical protein KP509_1Z002400 [Ceratopteris richardii]|nr:hypothetical protein KP509_1Z002400 [Ceratopteris richardii]
MKALHASASLSCILWKSTLALFRLSKFLYMLRREVLRTICFFHPGPRRETCICLPSLNTQGNSNKSECIFQSSFDQHLLVKLQSFLILSYARFVKK